MKWSLYWHIDILSLFKRARNTCPSIPSSTIVYKYVIAKNRTVFVTVVASISFCAVDWIWKVSIPNCCWYPAASFDFTNPNTLHCKRYVFSIRPLKINCAFWVTSLVAFALFGRKTRALYFMFNFSHTSIRLVFENCPLQERPCLIESCSCMMHYPIHKVIIYLRCHTVWCHTWCPSQTGARFNIISEKAARFFHCACFFASLARSFLKNSWLKTHN